MQKIADLLTKQKVKDLLNDETKWTRGAFARDASNDEVLMHSDAAVRWCLLGAICKCYTFDEDEDKVANTLDKVERAIGIDEINKWNDAPERTFDDVRALVIELDI